jgi:hypothetical protein
MTHLLHWFAMGIQTHKDSLKKTGYHNNYEMDIKEDIDENLNELDLSMRNYMKDTLYLKSDQEFEIKLQSLLHDIPYYKK